MSAGPPRALVLAIGEEILQGRIADSNSSWLARELLALGFEVRRFLTVGDAPGDLQRALTEADGSYALVASTGGLGPTADDRVRAEAAASAGVALQAVPGAVEALDELFRSRYHNSAPEPYRAQGRVPAGARALANAAGTAWAFALPLPRGSLYVALPGPPREAAAAWQEGGGRAACAERSPAHGSLLYRAFHTAGQPESAVEARIHELLAHSVNPTYGITANAEAVTVSMLARGEGPGREAQVLMAAAESDLRQRLGDLLWGSGGETLADVVVRGLRAAGATVACAESCSGGRIAAALTSVPGASAVFGAGWVCYANESKERELGVRAETLARHGAVSEAVAVELASGARSRAGATWGLSATGVAGPDGGSPEKPVGLIWIGVAGPSGAYAVPRQQWSRAGRASIQRQTVRDALDALRRELGGLPRLAPRH
jgi:nicotinamide-nucleotide amidase